MWIHRHPPFQGGPFYREHFSEGRFYGRDHFMGRHPYLPGPSSMHLVVTALWVALLLLLVCALLIWFSRKRMPKVSYYPAPVSSQPNALEILRQRYALGEIDEVMFENMRERLEALDARERPPND